MESLNSRAEKRVCIESSVLFIAPIFLVLVLYLGGVLIDITLAYYIIYLVYIAGTLLILKRRDRKLSEIGLTKVGLQDSVLIALGFVTAFIIVQVLRSDLRLLPELSGLMIMEQLVYNYALSGLAQELLFRGLMLFSIAKWRGWKVALVITSVLFGTVHLLKGPGFVLATAIIGAAYGLIVYRTRNIVGPILAHGSYNFILGFLLTG